MTVGIRIKGDAGNIQIGSDFPNMVLREKGTVVPGGGISPANFSRTGLTSPILFLSGASQVIGYACKNASGSFSFLVFSAMGSTPTVTYYIFDVPLAPAAHGAGVRIYDSANNCTFNSNDKALRIVDQLLVSPGGTVTYTAGRQYACAHVAFGLREQYITGFFDWIGSAGNVGSISTGYIHYKALSGPVNNFRVANILVADVTGY